MREQKPASIVEAHTSEILSLDYNKFEENLLATSSVDKSIAIWDLRNLKCKLFSLRGHKDEVTSVKFSKFHSNLLASSSNDRKINIWDLSRIDKPLTEEEKKDGPPELLFVHAGHTQRISDMSWNLNERLMMASCAEDNIVQVW